MPRRADTPLIPADDPWLAQQRARSESELIDQICDALLCRGDEGTSSTEEALKQLAAGTYGYCLDCHERIPAERLEGLTFAVRCADCEPAAEPEVTLDENIAHMATRLQ
jgi:DnaK suppressor protein